MTGRYSKVRGESAVIITEDEINMEFESRWRAKDILFSDLTKQKAKEKFEQEFIKQAREYFKDKTVLVVYNGGVQ